MIAGDLTRLACGSAEIRPQLDDRPPLLALNVLGTGEGGMEAEKGAIHRALFPVFGFRSRSWPADGGRKGANQALHDQAVQVGITVKELRRHLTAG